MSIREKLFGRPERDALMRVIREQEERLELLRNIQVGVLDAAEAWEKRYFEQRRQYDELVFSQRRLIHEGLQGASATMDPRTDAERKFLCTDCEEA